MDHTKDYYAILGVTTSTEQVVIRAAYKALAQKYHPDKLDGNNLADNLMMSAINEAYSILGDPLKRAQYDQLRSGLFQEANSPPKEPPRTPPKKAKRQAPPRASRWTAPLDRIDNWPTKDLIALQERIASALGKSVVFRDPSFSAQSGGLFSLVSRKTSIRCPELVVIPPGKLMGHLEIVEPFALGRYAATNAEYLAFCHATGRKKPKDSWKSQHPVQYVSLKDAMDYCAWLSSSTRQEYRLPAQKEWEFACRAGTTTRYSFGDEITPYQANFGGLYALYDPKSDLTPKPKYPMKAYRGINGPVDVSEFQPNNWGLFQMHGNVAELVAEKKWCGNGWMSVAEGLASDHVVELEETHDEKTFAVGFRVARSF